MEIIPSDPDSPRTQDHQRAEELDRLKWKVVLGGIAALVVLVFVAILVLDIAAFLVTPIGIATAIVVILGIGGVAHVLGMRDKAPQQAVKLVRTFPVGDLATCTGLVETCGRLRGNPLITPVAKLQALWFRVTVDDLSGDPPIVDFTMGDDLRIYDETGEASIAVHGATMLMQRRVEKTTEESPTEIAELLRARGVEPPAWGTLRVREQWLAPEERVWVRAHVEARSGDAYRGGRTEVSLVGAATEPVTIALEPLLAHAESPV